MENIRGLTLAELIAGFDQAGKSINENDGRLTANSSAQLDSDMEDQDDLAIEIVRRLGIEKRLTPIIREEVRKRMVARKRSLFIRALVRLGIVSIDWDGDVRWPIAWNRNGQFWGVGIFRNCSGVVKWLSGRWLPRRWGFCFYWVEIGDRGSSNLPPDPTRIGLFSRRPKP